MSTWCALPHASSLAGQDKFVIPRRVLERRLVSFEKMRRSLHTFQTLARHWTHMAGSATVRWLCGSSAATRTTVAAEQSDGSTRTPFERPWGAFIPRPLKWCHHSSCERKLMFHRHDSGQTTFPPFDMVNTKFREFLEENLIQYCMQWCKIIVITFKSNVYICYYWGYRGSNW